MIPQHSPRVRLLSRKAFTTFYVSSFLVKIFPFFFIRTRDEIKVIPFLSREKITTINTSECKIKHKWFDDKREIFFKYTNHLSVYRVFNHYTTHCETYFTRFMNVFHILC